MSVVVVAPGSGSGCGRLGDAAVGLAVSKIGLAAVGADRVHHAGEVVGAAHHVERETGERRAQKDIMEKDEAAKKAAARAAEKRKKENTPPPDPGKQPPVAPASDAPVSEVKPAPAEGSKTADASSAAEPTAESAADTSTSADAKVEEEPKA